MMKAVIVANGDINDYTFARQVLSDCIGYDYIVACDGGLRHCHALGIVPDHIVGDLDSAPMDILKEYQDVPVLKYAPEKDQTDLELALAFACEKGVDSVVVLGGLGGRIDHQLGNVHVLAQAVKQGIRAELRDEHTRVRLIDKACQMHKQDGVLVTLLPLTTTVDGIVTEGLAYPLAEESLSVGFARGVSNKFAGEVATVRIKKGLLLVIQTAV
ncbi:MAG: thiamine diphosphokinase [Defluviitaleaceae bacterium]|nr:thiamine diphosphokinase [Defluviitaleaceae bacterium]